MNRTLSLSATASSPRFRLGWIAAGVFAISSTFATAAELQPLAFKATTQQLAMQTAGPVCAICGTVESLTEVQRESAPSGLGALAGAALGGWIANQVGGNDGHFGGRIQHRLQPVAHGQGLGLRLLQGGLDAAGMGHFL